MDDVLKLPQKEKKSLISKIIDALLEIRLLLAIRKMGSPTITKVDFKKMLDDTKQKYQDVETALDDVFEEYLPVEKKEENKLEIPETPKETSTYEDSGSEKGTSMVKRNKNQFNSSREVYVEPSN